MRLALKILGVVIGAVAMLLVGIGIYLWSISGQDPLEPLYLENCAVCHGDALQGAAQGPALVGRALAHGETVTELITSIARGFPQRGMPGWSGILDEGQVRSLAILIAEKRVDRQFTDFKADKVLQIPAGAITTEGAEFRIDTLTSGIDPSPFSIAPLPDGRILVTEKTRGLSLVSPDGTLAPIAGTPETGALSFKLNGLDIGLGWLLDVAPHPGYLENGWIYLVHTHLCDGCRTDGDGLMPSSMVRLIRGRIADDQWVDEEVIWSAPGRYYSTTPDLGAGGRLAFSPDGHVFVSVGLKGNSNYDGVQDLRTPYGKIHRIHDDGRVPIDNPFANRAGAMPSIWSYGHRSPQGLEYDRHTGLLWGTEMGPRGGDEVNLLRPGRNYGWPLYSIGVDYDGTPVEYWKDLGIEFDLAVIEQPVVDLTPSPAVSSLVVYQGAAFPAWRGNLIVGSLKATELYRIVLDGDRHVRSEVLLRDLARIRDVEVDPDGAVLLLLEHASGSRIVRLTPAG